MTTIEEVEKLLGKPVVEVRDESGAVVAIADLVLEMPGHTEDRRSQIVANIQYRTRDQQPRVAEIVRHGDSFTFDLDEGGLTEEDSKKLADAILALYIASCQRTGQYSEREVWLLRERQRRVWAVASDGLSENLISRGMPEHRAEAVECVYRKGGLQSVSSRYNTGTTDEVARFVISAELNAKRREMMSVDSPKCLYDSDWLPEKPFVEGNDDIPPVADNVNSPINQLGCSLLLTMVGLTVACTFACWVVLTFAKS
jgi:hypothetical protein